MCIRDRSWRPKTEGDYALSKEMMDDWTNFMKTGNPNAEGKDDWKPCTKAVSYTPLKDCSCSRHKDKKTVPQGMREQYKYSLWLSLIHI